MECGLGRTLRWIDSRLSQVFWTLLYPSLSGSYASWAIPREPYGTVAHLKFWTCCLMIL